jgi:hypothetical protein
MNIPDPNDTLLGAQAITNFVNSLVDPQVSKRAVEHWVERALIPTSRFGRTVTASKTQIRAALSTQPAPMIRANAGMPRPQAPQPASGKYRGLPPGAYKR